jgi:hypothetical protein
MGQEDYLRALLDADAPAEMFALPVSLHGWPASACALQVVSLVLNPPLTQFRWLHPHSFQVIEGIIRVKWEAFGWRLLLLLLLEHLGFLAMVTAYLLLVVQENQVC